jgi:hypothetical protein
MLGTSAFSVRTEFSVGTGALITDTCESGARDVGGERAKAKTGVFLARGVAVERLVAVGGVGAVRVAAVEREGAGGGVAAPVTLGGAEAQPPLV